MKKIAMTLTVLSVLALAAPAAEARPGVLRKVKAVVLLPVKIIAGVVAGAVLGGAAGALGTAFEYDGTFGG